MEENFSKDVGNVVENIYLYLLLSKEKENKFQLMKSKIVALSKKEEFKSLLKKKKVSNKYVTIFFGILNNKNNKKFNISFSVKKKNRKCC